MKRTLASLTAVLLLAGCSKVPHNYNLECDRGDYIERDSDCGYYSDDRVWRYFNWTKPGVTTYSPDGWEPPAGVEIEEETKIKTKKTKH